MRRSSRRRMIRSTTRSSRRLDGCDGVSAASRLPHLRRNLPGSSGKDVPTGRGLDVAAEGGPAFPRMGVARFRGRLGVVALGGAYRADGCAEVRARRFGKRA